MRTHREAWHAAAPQLLAFSPGKEQAAGVWETSLAPDWPQLRSAVVLPPPARGAGTLIPSAQRLVWAAKQPLGNEALGALFA